MPNYPNYFSNYQVPNYPSLNVQPQLSQLSQPAQSQSGIIWVQGEAGAKSYLVAPNTTIALWDSEDKVIYLKSSDASGMPSIKTIDYTIRENTSQANSLVPESRFITKDEISIIEDRLNALEGKFEGLNKPNNKRRETKDE